MHRQPPIVPVAALLCALGMGGPALAGPGYYLVQPYAEPGRLTLDLRYWTVKAPGREAVLWPELGMRWGINSRWTTGLLASWVGRSLRSQQLELLQWQNTWLLTQGEQPWDLALHAQLDHITAKGTALSLGPLLQTELGHAQLNLNLFLEHDWSRREGTRFKLQWQALQRLGTGVRLGVQGFAELGRWSDWEHTSVRTGPVLRLALPGQLEWQAAYLWGRTFARRGDMFSSQLTLPF